MKRVPVEKKTDRVPFVDVHPLEAWREHGPGKWLLLASSSVMAGLWLERDDVTDEWVATYECVGREELARFPPSGKPPLAQARPFLVERVKKPIGVNFQP